VKNLDYSAIDEHIVFDDEDSKRKRINFLSIQLREINKLDIDKKAKALYIHKYTFPDDIVSRRCLDFKTLEAACIKYITEEIQITKNQSVTDRDTTPARFIRTTEQA